MINIKKSILSQDNKFNWLQLINNSIYNKLKIKILILTNFLGNNSIIDRILSFNKTLIFFSCKIYKKNNRVKGIFSF
jgi:hypothetical protein